MVRLAIIVCLYYSRCSMVQLVKFVSLYYCRCRMVHLFKIVSVYYSRCRMVHLVKIVSVYYCRCSKVLEADIVCESQVIAVYQYIVDSLDNGDKIDAIIDDFSKAFDLVPHGRLLTEIANSGVDSRVVVWIREFILGRTQTVRVGWGATVCRS